MVVYVEDLVKAMPYTQSISVYDIYDSMWLMNSEPVERFRQRYLDTYGRWTVRSIFTENNSIVLRIMP